MFEVEYTDEFEAWWGRLSVVEQIAVEARVDVLAHEGPTLGRPTVDRVSGSAYHNMKELRIARADIRILFAFDLRRHAILLLGGSKTGQWNAWYQVAIPEADRLYAEHLQQLQDEGLIEKGDQR